MIVQHNIPAINSHRNLGINNTNLSKNLEKLSSGYRINRAADDAAGLAISEKMRAQITGLNRAVMNAQDGASLIQTAEGALQEVHGMLNRMVELATQSANGTIQADDRQKIEAETQALKDEIDRISQATNFNGIKLLDGSLSESGVQEITVGNLNTTFVPAKAGISELTFDALDGAAEGDKNTITVSLSDGSSYDLTFERTANANEYIVNGNTYTGLDTAANVANAVKSELEKVDAFTEKFKIDVAGAKLTLTAKEAGTKAPQVSGFSHTSIDGTTIAGSTISSATPATDAYKSSTVGVFDTTKTGIDQTGDEAAMTFTVNGVKFAVAKDAASAKVLQDRGVNVHISDMTTAADYEKLAALINQKTGLNVSNINPATGTAAAGLYFSELPGSGKGLTMQVGDTAHPYQKITVSVDDMSSTGLGIAGISMGTQEAAAASMDAIKAAIEKVSVNRGNLGALQNRLEHTINNLNVTSENMTAAESRIRDVDMAKEMMAFTKNNVLSQAAQAMLAQANQQPQQVLQLLR